MKFFNKKVISIVILVAIIVIGAKIFSSYRISNTTVQTLHVDTNLLYQNIQDTLSPKYGKYVMKPKPDFLVLPKEEFMAEYARAQIARQKRGIAEFQAAIDKNEISIIQNDKDVAHARTLTEPTDQRLVQMEKQAEDFRKQALQINDEYKGYIALKNKMIENFSDSNSAEYKRMSIITGGFIPPKEVVIQTPKEGSSAYNNPKELTRMVMHEFLHYYASQNTTKELDVFSYEGFTEYLTLVAMNYSDQEMIKASGYPMHIQIMSMLARRIPLSTIMDIHFNQDQSLLEASFKKYFPNNDYPEFLRVTEQIDGFWINGGFGKENSAYINNPLVLRVKGILKL